MINLRVSGASGGYLVLADSFFPGWVATVSDARNGGVKEQPILPAYGVLRAVPLPAAGGSYVRIEMTYRPWSWRIGAMVSLTSACLFVLLAVGTLLTQNRR